MTGDLGTTNILLGIMAAVSLLEALVIIGIGIVGYKAYRKTMGAVDDAVTLVKGIEARHVVPAMARYHKILDDVQVVIDDVQVVAATVREETERVDNAIHTTIERIDTAASIVKSTVWAKASAVIATLQGIRSAIGWMRRPRTKTYNNSPQYEM